MAVKNAAAKNWVITPSFDGYLYSAYPNGDKPSGYQTAPTLLDTDIVAGSLTGFENNKGCYLRLYGYSFGRGADLGTAAGARVYLRDPIGDNVWHEVDNYRALNTSRVYDSHQIVRIIVQVGSLGGSQTAGRSLDVKITVNGVDTNVLTGQFKIQPGRCAYISTTGDDSTALFDDVTKPFRYAQYTTGGGGTDSYVGLWAATTPMGETGLRGGDTICFRAGTWSDQVGFNTRFVRFRSHTGTAPNGTAGQGYISFTAHPGAAGANSPEVMQYTDPASGRGGIMGVNSAYDGTYGQYVTISGLQLQGNATSVSDAGPINLQSGANNWRVYDNECGPWPSTTTSPNNALAGGIAGNGNGIKIKFNYVHDIASGVGSLQNHGMYFDASTNVAKNFEVAYNWIKDITGGSSLQCYQNGAVGQTFSGVSIHHNVMDACAKYNINFNDSVSQADVYNNVLLNAGWSTFRFNDIYAGATINFTYNTCYTSIAQANANMFRQDGGNITTGATTVMHNIFAFGGSASATTDYTNFGAASTALTMAKNLYHDAAGIKTTVPTKDTTGIYGNPNFTSATLKDFTCLTGGAGLNAATGTDPISVTTDLFGITRPVSTNNDIGACEGIGT